MKEKIITAIIHLFPDDDWDGRQRIRTLSCRQLISPLKKKRRGKKINYFLYSYLDLIFVCRLAARIYFVINWLHQFSWFRAEERERDREMELKQIDQKPGKYKIRRDSKISCGCFVCKRNNWERNIIYVARPMDVNKTRASIESNQLRINISTPFPNRNYCKNQQSDRPIATASAVYLILFYDVEFQTLR